MAKSYKKEIIDQIKETIDTIAKRKDTDEQIFCLQQIVNLLNECGMGRWDAAETQREFRHDRLLVRVRWSKDNLIIKKDK